MKKGNSHMRLWALFILVLASQYATADDSGFIEDMPQLTQDPDRPGAMVWQKRGVNRASYTRVMFEPMTIFISPDSEYKGLNADELKTLADHFMQTVTQTLAPEVAVVPQGGPGVLYVRAALTNVKVTKKKRGFFDASSSQSDVAVAKGINVPGITLKDAQLEIESYDPISGERLGVLIDKAPESVDSDVLSWDSIDKTFAYYAERFKLRMLAAR